MTTKTKKKTSKSRKSKREKLYEELKERLLQERKQLMEEAMQVHNVREINAHGDIVDQSNDYSDRELLLGLAEHDRHRIIEINDALKRMEKGTYGICEMSGEEISEDRLKAMPTAKYTLECQSKIEGNR